MTFTQCVTEAIFVFEIDPFGDVEDWFFSGGFGVVRTDVRFGVGFGAEDVFEHLDDAGEVVGYGVEVGLFFVADYGLVLAVASVVDFAMGGGGEESGGK